MRISKVRRRGYSGISRFGSCFRLQCEYAAQPLFTAILLFALGSGQAVRAVRFAQLRHPAKPRQITGMMGIAFSSAFVMPLTGIIVLMGRPQVWVLVN